MEKRYMDYGAFNNSQPPLVEIEYNSKGQVYYLTHDGEGKALPFLDRAYISFTYGGKRIEEFDLVAVTENSRLERETSANFSNNTTDYEILNGQFYWGSKYEANELALTLFTDGISQEKLDQFKYWFRAGEIRQLILSQHPNRGILARVNEAPRISVLPFQEKQWLKLGGQQREVIVTKYKGSIQLTFVMDDPFWYAIHNFLGDTTYDTDLGKFLLKEQWIDANGNVIDTLDDDGWRVVAEDHIPTAGVLNLEMLLGQGSEIYYDHPYKYTLSTLSFPVKVDEQGNITNIPREIQGTPVANTDEDNISINSGAVAGPFYQKVWVDDEVITKASKLAFIENKKMNQSGKVIEGTTLTDSCTVALIPAKVGSTIKLKRGYSSLQVDIAIFNKDTEEFEGFITPSLQAGQQYIVSQDCYLRIYLDRKNRLLDDVLEIKITTFSTGTGASLTSDKKLYVFYSGTAPSLPKISFDTNIHFNQNGYIDTFNSSFIKTEDGKVPAYNTLRLQSERTHDLKFTLPSIFISYNTVIQKLNDENVKQDISSVIQAFRESVNHVGVRNWIIGCINSYVAKYNKDKAELDKITMVDDDMIAALKVCMPYLFYIKEKNKNSFSTSPNISFSINNQTGEATATFKYNYISNIPTDDNVEEEENESEEENENEENNEQASEENFSFNGADIISISSIKTEKYIQRQEHIGDMIIYNNFILEERNQFEQSTGTIQMWRENSPLLSHKLTYDGKYPLDNFKFYYKNLYL